MVGLYETALDYLCKINKNSKRILPKIIASTATVRRAREQISSLYNRDVFQFPPPGINAEDSFFAKEDEIDYAKGKFGRVYVGLMPSGKTKLRMEARTMATMLQNIHSLNLPDNIKDKLWTLTVYFNSIRDLGQADTMLNDSVKDDIIRIASKRFLERRLLSSHDELTSRVQTTELNKILDKLEKIEYSKENLDNKKYPSSVLLASNMISVGLDVSRLNVMLLVGQPKLTSEYIQASSRVGRSYPGVVFVQYDATKSRDRSHYEQFNLYHSCLYENYSEEIENIEDFIVRRITDITKRSTENITDDINVIKDEIKEFFEFWQNTIERAKEDGKDKVVYGNVTEKGDDKKSILFKSYDYKNRNDNARIVMTSMRNVDQNAKGKVIISWDDEDES